MRYPDIFNVLEMECVRNFWLKVAFINRSDIHHKHGPFCYWIFMLGQKSSIYEVNQKVCLTAIWGISIIFFLYHFSSSFIGQQYKCLIHIPFWSRKRCLDYSYVVLECLSPTETLCFHGRHFSNPGQLGLTS